MLLEEGGWSIPGRFEVQGWLVAPLDPSLLEQMPVGLMCFGECGCCIPIACETGGGGGAALLQDEPTEG